jgi:hypothetical protein
MRRKNYELEKSEAWFILLSRILGFRTFFRLGTAWAMARGAALFPGG